MSQGARFAVLLAAAAAALALAAGALFLTFRGTVPPAEQPLLDAALAAASGALAFMFAMLVVALGLVLHALFRRYVREPRRLAEEARIIASANPHHRVVAPSTGELADLAAAINALGERVVTLQHDLELHVSAATSEIERERTRLAALMSQMSESVIVCNSAGRVLLYNSSAQQLVSSAAGAGDEAPHALLGLGRSLFSAIDRDAIAHAVDELQHRLDSGEENPVSRFVTTTATGAMLRGRVSPVLIPKHSATEAPGMDGFVLVLDDITREAVLDAARNDQLARLVSAARATLATMTAAAENLIEHPRLAAHDRRRFLEAIVSESRRLAAEVTRADAEQRSSHPAFEIMRGEAFLNTLARAIEARTSIAVSVSAEGDPWIAADRRALAEPLVWICERLRDRCGVIDLSLAIRPHGSHAQVDLAWLGDVLRPELAREWQKERVGSGDSLDAAVQRHGGEAWYARGADGARFRLALPLAQAEAPHPASAMFPSRPMFYDFDLFHQPGQSMELDSRRLAELSYTVFDTETTGLAPSQGDEIVSIGAVRIVNGRLLTGEIFDQLVKPRRPLGPTTIGIHGITDEMVEGAPDITRVLPAFHRYCEDTVLVAHNAAFDMRFLQLKQAETGVRFDHPVLDTLMLSAVIHPEQFDHTLEAIASRLGVRVWGRHTSVGDALVTGEMFLKMLPLLAAKGIHTLGEAREAALHTPYAQVAY